MVEVTVDIAATVEDVWAVLVDVERWPEWTRSMSEVKLLDAEALALGVRVRIKQPRLPVTVWQVTGLEPLRSFTWEASNPGVTTVAEHRLASPEPSRTKVTLGIRRSGPLAPVIDLVFRGLTAAVRRDGGGGAQAAVRTRSFRALSSSAIPSARAGSILVSPAHGSGRSLVWRLKTQS